MQIWYFLYDERLGVSSLVEFLGELQAISHCYEASQIEFTPLNKCVEQG